MEIWILHFRHKLPKSLIQIIVGWCQIAYGIETCVKKNKLYGCLTFLRFKLSKGETRQMLAYAVKHKVYAILRALVRNINCPVWQPAMRGDVEFLLFIENLVSDTGEKYQLDALPSYWLYGDLVKVGRIGMRHCHNLIHWAISYKNICIVEDTIPSLTFEQLYDNYASMSSLERVEYINSLK